jgi:hypothetical protein
MVLYFFKTLELVIDCKEEFIKSEIFLLIDKYLDIGKEL